MQAILYSEKMKAYDLGHVLTGERYENFLHLSQYILGTSLISTSFPHFQQGSV
jgi:hypothetical protein